MVNTLKRSDDDFSSAVDRRARLHRRARLVVLAAVVGYFFLPYEVQAVIPVWLLFVAALGLEVEFFVGGWLQARQGVAPGPVDRGPQPRDLEELGPQYDEFEPLSLFPTDWYRAPRGGGAASPVALRRRGGLGTGNRRGRPVLRRATERLGRGLVGEPGEGGSRSSRAKRA